MTSVKETAKALGVHNSHGVMSKFSAGDPPVMVYYRAQQTGRAYQCAAWQVIHMEHKTAPGEYWRDQGHKTFDVHHRAQREPQLHAALAWATERYGVAYWERTVFGDYHPAETVARFKAAVKARQKAAVENPTPQGETR